MLFNYEDNFSGFVGDLDSEVASWGFACDGWPKSERVVHLFSHLATNSSPQTLPRIYDIHQRPLSPVSKGTVIALRTTSPRRRPPPSLTVVCRAVRRREGRLNHQKGLRYGPTPHHSSPYFAPHFCFRGETDSAPPGIADRTSHMLRIFCGKCEGLVIWRHESVTLSGFLVSAGPYSTRPWWALGMPTCRLCQCSQQPPTPSHGVRSPWNQDTASGHCSVTAAT
jgi:hypothetical protein